ncbi:hypothetical protein DL98DRAFT_528285 [Cadophora sp. DSE1049]|nr:hypothetical protein DL98DRAFT_528285 [Cadophora sp. DSE1049]
MSSVVPPNALDSLINDAEEDQDEKHSFALLPKLPLEAGWPYLPSHRHEPSQKATATITSAFTTMFTFAAAAAAQDKNSFTVTIAKFFHLQPPTRQETFQSQKAMSNSAVVEAQFDTPHLLDLSILDTQDSIRSFIKHCFISHCGLSQDEATELPNLFKGKGSNLKMCDMEELSTIYSAGYAAVLHAVKSQTIGGRV